MKIVPSIVELFTSEIDASPRPATLDDVAKAGSKHGRSGEIDEDLDGTPKAHREEAETAKVLAGRLRLRLLRQCQHLT